MSRNNKKSEVRVNNPFGAPSADNSNQSTFGSFGQGNSTGFGTITQSSGSGNLFGAAASSSPFAAPASTSAFGAFGQPSTASTPVLASPFGAPAGGSAFGAFGQPATTPSLFGQSAAATTGSTFGSFGQPAAATNASTFGQPAVASNSSTFGSFGRPAAASSTSTFGAFGQPAAASGTSTFGAFGQPAAATGTSTFSPFGQPIPAASATSTFGAFGQPAASATSFNPSASTMAMDAGKSTTSDVRVSNPFAATSGGVLSASEALIQYKTEFRKKNGYPFSCFGAPDIAPVFPGDISPFELRWYLENPTEQGSQEIIKMITARSEHLGEDFTEFLRAAMPSGTMNILQRTGPYRIPATNYPSFVPQTPFQIVPSDAIALREEELTLYKNKGIHGDIRIPIFPPPLEFR